MLSSLIQFASHNPIFVGGAGVGLLGGLMAWARNVPSSIGNLVFRELTSSVFVSNEDAAYNWFKRWLEEHPYSQKSRNIIATVGWSERNDLALARSELKFTPAFGGHVFFYKRNLVWLRRDREKNSQDRATGQRQSYETIIVRVLGRNKQILLDLCADIEQLGSKDREDGFIDLYVNRYGHWNYVRKTKARGLESVILDDDKGEMVVKDVKTFLNDAKWYADKGIPHRRGYLFYGIPGSGKSSLAIAVAGELNMDIYILSLAEKNLTDADLLGLMQTVKRRSVLLFEDVDAIFNEKRAKKKGEDGDSGVTFSGLLNAIDGVASKEGVVLFMSTNHIDRLDPALIRPGRADVKVEFFKASHSQVERLFERFYPHTGPTATVFADAVGTRNVTMAEVQEYLLRYRNDYKLALENVNELVPQTTKNAGSAVPVVSPHLPCASSGC